MSTQGFANLRSVVFDCPDPVSLANFYAAVLGGTTETGDPGFCVVNLEGSPRLAFQLVQHHQAPQWPEGTPQQIHLDLTVPDLSQASARAVELGASVLKGPTEELGCTFIVHRDPAGHPFCLCQDQG
ncbi:MAG: VOC family protein [Acidimicrobiales bacterium]